MTLLTYKEKFIISDNSHDQTSTTSTYVDDTYAIKTDLVLTETNVVFAIYQTTSLYGSANDYKGRGTQIKINSTAHCRTFDSSYSGNYSSRNFSYWVGTLDAGTHTIKGQFAAIYSGQTVTISERSLIIYVFNGDSTSFRYIENTTGQSTASTYWINDAYATTTFTPGETCKSVSIYSATTQHLATSDGAGMWVAVKMANSAVTDSTAIKSSGNSNVGNSATTVFGISLSGSLVTIGGSFAAESGTIAISRSTLAVLLFNNEVQLDVATSNVQVSTTGTTRDDDDYLSIDRVFTGELLVLGQGSKYPNSTGSVYGQEYGFSIDGNDVIRAKSSPNSASSGESSFVAWGQTVDVTPEPHIVNGRFASNYGSNTAIIDRRIAVAVWMPSLYYVSITGSESGTGTATTANMVVNCHFTCSATGTGSITTAYMKVSYYITGSGTGTGSITTAHLTLFYRITGSGTGTGSITTAHLTLFYRITGSGTGTGSITTATTHIFKHILSNVSGTGSITTAHPTLNCRITGNGTGTGSITTAHADLYTLTSMACNSTSTGVVVRANVTLFNKISCSVSGSGSVTLAHMYRFVRIISSLSSSGTSSCTSVLNEYIPVSSELTGSGSTTATGYLAQSVSVSGSGIGTGNSTATSHKFLHIISSLTGTGSYTATHHKFIHIISSLTGTGNSTSVGKYFDHLVSNLTGTGSYTATYNKFLHIISSLTGIGVETNYLYTGSTLRCTVSGTGTYNVRTHLYLNILSTTTGIGTQVGLCGIVEDMTSNVSGIGDSSAISNILEQMYSNITGMGSSNAVNNMFLFIVGSETGVGSSNGITIITDFVTGIANGTGKSFGIAGIPTCNNSTVRVIPTEFLHTFFFPIEFLWTAEIVRLNIDASTISILVTYPTFDIEINP